MGKFSDSIHDFIVNLARNEMDHVTGIQYYLGTCCAALDVSSVNMELSFNARMVFQKHFVFWTSHVLFFSIRCIH